MKYYSVIRKNKILPFAATWMELKTITLREVRQAQKDKDCIFSFICGSLKSESYEDREYIGGYQRLEKVEGQVKGKNMYMCVCVCVCVSRLEDRLQKDKLWFEFIHSCGANHCAQLCK